MKIIYRLIIYQDYDGFKFCIVSCFLSSIFSFNYWTRRLPYDIEIMVSIE